MKLLNLLVGLALLAVSNASSAIVIECGVDPRIAFLGDVSATATCETGVGNFQASDINDAYGGDWSILGELEADSGNGFIGDDIFNADIQYGSWGSTPVGGTWSIGEDFWATNDSAIISIHIGNGGGDPDSFAWGLITEETLSGFFGVGFGWDGVSLETSFNSFTGDSITGISNIKLWGTDAVRVPEPSLIALFGIGLVGLGLARRRRKV